MFHSRVAIVPTRFIVSISHLIVVILCLMGTVLSPNPYAFYFHLTFAQSGNVISGLALTYTDAEFTSTKDSLVAALIVTLICIGIGAAHAYYLPNSIACIRTTAAHPPAPDFFGLFSGVSLKMNAMNAFQVRAPLSFICCTTLNGSRRRLYRTLLPSCSPQCFCSTIGLRAPCGTFSASLLLQYPHARPSSSSHRCSSVKRSTDSPFEILVHIARKSFTLCVCLQSPFPSRIGAILPRIALPAASCAA